MDKILIVDSSTQSTELMLQCLSTNWYEIYTSENGINALAKISLFKPDLIIIDVNLPDISGFEICKRVKANPDTQYIIFLFLCSFETTEMKIRALEVGADDFIEKSFDSFILISKVKSLLRLKHLSDQLKQKYLEIEEKNNLLNLQLKMSRQVQSAFLNDVDLAFNDIRIVSKYMPALDIGGDFYGVNKINDTCVSIVIGDVSGHGISAALLTSMLNMMSKNLSNRYFNPDQFLFYMNNEYCNVFSNNNSEMYACVFYAVIDTRAKKIYFSNAGQTLPIFVDAANENAVELEAVGLPIGLMRNSLYEFKVIEYKKGDMLLFHTDGLVDVYYKQETDEFTRKIKELLLDAKSTEEPDEIIQLILNAFYNLDANETDKFQMDDVSLLLCKL